MTLKEFFRKARRGRKWEVMLSSSGKFQVRCANGLCPLAALTGIWVPEAAARELGITARQAWKIASAADYSWDRARPWLLKNLGIRA